MTNKTQNLDRLIADYVRGCAEPEQARQLELAMLEDDELFYRIQVEQLMMQGLQSTDLREPRRGLASGLFGHWPGKALIGGLSAALVLLGVYVITLERQLERLTLPEVEVTVVTLLAERDLLPGRTERAPATGSTLIEIDVSGFDQERFELEIGLGEEVRRWPAVRVDERGYLSVYVPNATRVKWIKVLDDAGEVIRQHEFR